VTLRPFYAYQHEAPAEPEPVEELIDDPHNIAWGYNLADLDRLARVAVSRARTKDGNYRLRYESAWSAVAEALCAAETRPEPGDLVEAGWRAVVIAVHEEMHHKGYDTNHGGSSAPGFVRYWEPHLRTGSHENSIIEKTALWQIWSRLTPREQQALNALAATGNQHAAAAATGKAIDSMSVRVNAARRHFLRYWHEGETPSRPWRASTHAVPKPRMYRGKRRLTESEVESLRVRYHNGETLTSLAAESGVGRSTLSALFLGRRRPALDGAA
jgi:hypothetical protein